MKRRQRQTCIYVVYVLVLVAWNGGVKTQRFTKNKLDSVDGARKVREDSVRVGSLE